ncbi:four helix bundle protein [Flagellimonas pelagia]|uniref:Four helix bundle protein n=1 Tax=Flagellimonas pelagia TaxID=2306998 RepID=A0A3A1NMG0_9FLAO|nr:four helix bundle protein [Allomuricauda maritima]RIV45884.1 four helix bundle protein [Allomuricauda maritima]TXJ98645.1 four helix bundle protein [Allomuricauda maritima]
MLIEDKTFKFSLSIIKLVKDLKANKEFVFADQLLRSSTSIGANVVEAGAGQSKRDFITKMAIASKEARETRYWLRLIKESKLTKIGTESYLDEIDQIIKILTKIVKTSQETI